MTAISKKNSKMYIFDHLKKLYLEAEDLFAEESDLPPIPILCTYMNF